MKINCQVVIAIRMHHTFWCCIRMTVSKKPTADCSKGTSRILYHIKCWRVYYTTLKKLSQDGENFLSEGKLLVAKRGGREEKARKAKEEDKKRKIKQKRKEEKSKQRTRRERGRQAKIARDAKKLQTTGQDQEQKDEGSRPPRLIRTMIKLMKRSIWMIRRQSSINGVMRGTNLMRKDEALTCVA